MKILHVDTATEWRGGQNQIVLTAEGQLARGHDVKVFANTEGELAPRARKAGVPVHTASIGRGDLSWTTFRSIRDATLAFRPDVVHVHESHGLPGSIRAARALHPRALVVASRRVDFPLRFMSRFKYGQTDRVLAVSAAVRDVLLRSGLRREQLRLVHEGVKDRQAVAGGSAILRSLGVEEGAEVVGNVAQLVDHKDHATLIRAAAVVLKARPWCRFVICGDGPLKTELLTLANSLGVADHVIFGGFRSDLEALIPAFDVFCLSSHLEGLGTSVLDAMCFSRPVVATRAGGIPDAVIDRETGRLVDARDHQSLAAALIETLESHDLRKSYGGSGRERFLKHFTQDAMVENTLAAYA